MLGHMEKKLYTSAEVALSLGVSQRTVRRWVREGRMVPYLVLPNGAARFEATLEVKAPLWPKGLTAPSPEGEP